MRALDSFRSAHLQPKLFPLDQATKQTIVAALLAQTAVGQLADDTWQALLQPGEDLAGGRLTAMGFVILRRQVAQRALDRYRAEILPAFDRAQAVAMQARAAFRQGIAAAQRDITGIELAAAQALGDAYRNDERLQDSDRSHFRDQVAAGVRSAVVAAMTMPRIGSWAPLVERAETIFGESLLPTERRKEVRKVELAYEILAEQREIEGCLRQLAGAATEVPLSGGAMGRYLLERANDEVRVARLEEARELGLIEEDSASLDKRRRAADHERDELKRARHEAASA